MKILLKNLNYTLNYGTMMMGEIVIKKISENINDVSFFIDKANNQDVERLKQATEYKKIFKDAIYKKNTGKGLLNKIKFKILHFFYSIKQSKFYDYIIILGGDDYSELYFKSTIGVLINLFTLRILNKNKKLFMIGQTIGPYTRN